MSRELLLKRFATGDVYFRALDSCFGGQCSVKLFNASPEEWAAAIKKAEGVLTYCDKDATIGDMAKLGIDGVRPAALSNGSILDFDAIITTTRKDRDGDILETAGAIVDPHCPLLWAHIPVQPIGKMVNKTQHTKSVLAGRFAIFDTDLGRDAAVLVEGGALRISHGFEPIEYEPLNQKDGRWRISKFTVVEVSLVSVPSNVDAVIQAFSRKQLHSPLIKGWAGKLFDARPVMVKGAGAISGGASVRKGEGAMDAFQASADAHKATEEANEGEKDPAHHHSSRAMQAAAEHDHEGAAMHHLSAAMLHRKAGDEEAADAHQAAAEAHAAHVHNVKSGKKCSCGGTCDKCKGHHTKADALQECVSAKIKIIADDHPEMSPEQRVAVAYSYCGEGKSIEQALANNTIVRAKIQKFMGSIGLEGSHEELRERLCDQLTVYLLGQGINVDDDSYAYVQYVFDSYVVACVHFAALNQTKYYKIEFTRDGGEPKFTGEPKEIDLKLTEEEKRIMAAGVKRPIDQGPSVPATNGDMTMGPQQGGDTDARPHRDIVRRIVQVGHDEVKQSGKAGQVYWNANKAAVHHVMHSDDAENPDKYDSANTIEGRYKAVDGVKEAHAVVEQHPSVDGGYLMIHPGGSAKAGRAFSAENIGKLHKAHDHLKHAIDMGEEAFHPVAHTLVKAAHGHLADMVKMYGKPVPEMSQDKPEGTATDNETIGKAGRAISMENLKKLGAAHEHLTHALGMGEKAFHPVAHTMVKSAHGIVSGMCKDYGAETNVSDSADGKGFTMGAPQEPPDQVNGGTIRTTGSGTDGYDGKPSGHQYNAGQLFAAPKDQQMPPGNSAVATNAQAGIQPHSGEMFAAPLNSSPSGGKEFRQPQMPQMFSINRDESTGEDIGERAVITPKFNWDVVGTTLVLMADENPEKAAEILAKLGERLKEIQKKKDLDLVCEQLFA